MADPHPGTPGRIFISYRREETAYPAGWLYDRLADHLGEGQVFKDVDSIDLGDDFVEAITTAVGSCDVLLALIGDRWLTATDKDGKRRLDDPADFVRLEIEAALARKVRVIPILVEGATMPAAYQVPPSLAALTRRQALELSPSRFDFDTSRLLRVLDRTIAEVRTPDGDAASVTAPAVPGWRRRLSARQRLLVALGLATVLVSLVIGGIVVISKGDGAVFEDHFSSRAGGWDDAGAMPNGGHYANGAYRIYADQERNDGGEGSPPRNAGSVYPSAPADVRIGVDVRKIPGPDRQGGYGIFCRDDARSDNGYAFQIWDEDVAIVKYFDVDPGYKTLAQRLHTPVVDAAGANEMQATCTNAEGQRAVNLVFRVNGQKVAEYTDRDDPFLTGTVGLFVTDQAVEAEFDNFVVERP